MCLWSEPSGIRIVPAGTSSSGSHFSATYLNGTAYTEIRRFVVIGEGYGNSICSPIYTYGGQATLKPNLPDVQQHAIIHTSRQPPPEKFSYDDTGTLVKENLEKEPIRVINEQADEEGDLGAFSRINYSKIYTVEHYVRVLNIGKVHPMSMASLEKNSFFNRRANEPPQPPRGNSSKASSKGSKSSSSKRGGSSKSSRKGQETSNG
ncbi:hypothetical protein DL98DRAFT_417452 [Cadophora sp. DSE1049]|nr:hypothetical protein DL98DRAFT_417452 [Cadophora sp. DSE1049]